jgi:hypothetical protein
MPRIAAPNFVAGTAVAFVAITLASLACEGKGGTRAPDFTSFDSASPEQVLAYIRKLRFDPDTEAGDAKHLPVDSLPGPLVAIQPEKRSHKNRAADLAKGPGRIIAKLINRDSQPYPKLNLGPHDTVYWAVDQVKPVDKTLSRGRSLWISHTALVAKRDFIYEEVLYVDEHPGDPPYARALAKWIPDTGRKAGGAILRKPIETLIAWNSCKGGGCCR